MFIPRLRFTSFALSLAALAGGCSSSSDVVPGVERGAQCVGGGYPITCPGTKRKACPDQCDGDPDPGGPPANPCGTQPALPSDPELGAGWVVHAAQGGPGSVNYDQLPASSKYNSRSSCVSGCGGTAWAMLAGWTEWQQRNIALTQHWDTGRMINDYWISTSFGRAYQDTFLTTSIGFPATLEQNMTTWDDNWSRLTGGFADYMDSKCIGSEAFTEPRLMPSGGDYIKSWGGRVDVHSDYELSPNSVQTGRYLGDVRSWIDTYHVPVILGFNELSTAHFELVLAYARKASYQCSGNTWKLVEGDAWKMRVNHGWGDAAEWDDPPSAAWAAYTITVPPPPGPVLCADGSTGPELYTCPPCAPGDTSCSPDTVGTNVPFCARKCCGVPADALPCCVHPGHGVGCGANPGK
jgi:hypothetical protein